MLEKLCRFCFIRRFWNHTFTFYIIMKTINNLKRLKCIRHLYHLCYPLFLPIFCPFFVHCSLLNIYNDKRLMITQELHYTNGISNSTNMCRSFRSSYDSSYSQDIFRFLIEMKEHQFSTLQFTMLVLIINHHAVPFSCCFHHLNEIPAQLITALQNQEFFFSDYAVICQDHMSKPLSNCKSKVRHHKNS